MGDLLFFAGALAVLVWICFIAFSKRGKDMLFGGKIVKSWDGVSAKRTIVTTRVKVHAVQAAPTLQFVGLELSMSSFGGYQIVPITLPVGEARQLAEMLIEAADYRTDPVGT